MVFKTQPLLFGKFYRPGICRIGVTTVQAAGGRLHPEATGIHLSQRAPAYISATDENQSPGSKRAWIPGILPVGSKI